MITFKTLLASTAFCALSFVTFHAYAQDKKSNDGFLPEAHKELRRPNNITTCLTLNSFVSDAFSFYDKTNASRTSLQGIFTQLSTPGAAGTQDLLLNFNTCYQSLLSTLPTLEHMLSTSTDVFSDAKKQLSPLQYIQAAVMLKSALNAVRYSIADLKFMTTKTVPTLKSMFVSNKVPGADTIKIAQVSASDTLTMNR